jgi:hypothetical protein
MDSKNGGGKKEEREERCSPAGRFIYSLYTRTEQRYSVYPVATDPRHGQGKLYGEMLRLSLSYARVSVCSHFFVLLHSFV